jgi:hypothetical protein
MKARILFGCGCGCGGTFANCIDGRVVSWRGQWEREGRSRKPSRKETRRQAIKLVWISDVSPVETSARSHSFAPFFLLNVF